jgi:phage-related baseplate assembly protein
MEDDESLRQRIVLAPESFSVAGPELAYVFHARSADPLVADASCTSPTPGEVVVTVLGRDGDGTVSPQTIANVEATVNSRAVRPLTDHVTVQSVAPVYFNIEAQIFTFAGPDATIILANAQAKLDAYLAANRLIGRDISFSALNAALHVDGVQRVVLTSPAQTITISPLQVAHCTGVNVTFGGYDD